MPANAEIEKIHYSNNELIVFLRHGPMVTLNLIFTEIKP